MNELLEELRGIDEQYPYIPNSLRFLMEILYGYSDIVIFEYHEIQYSTKDLIRELYKEREAWRIESYDEILEIEDLVDAPNNILASALLDRGLVWSDTAMGHGFFSMACFELRNV